MRINLDSQNYIELILADETPRDVLLILPGGGYFFTSPREAIPVADAFADLLIHRAIFYYRQTKLIYPDVLDEGLLAIHKLKNHPLIRKLYIMGFSAGGHYALMLSTHGYEMIDATLLLYPVVSSEPACIHWGSFTLLTKDQLTKELLLTLSLEKHIHTQMKPVFVMHTVDDASVSVENSLLLMQALQQHRVLYEAHLFPSGRHGVSIATKEVAFDDMDPETFVKKYGALNQWVKHAKSFIRKVQHDAFVNE